MQQTDIPDWLRWAREIQAITQIGLLFSKSQDDERNFSRLLEISAVRFFDFNELPPLSEPRTTKRHLDDIAAHLLDPDRPAVFD